MSAFAVSPCAQTGGVYTPPSSNQTCSLPAQAFTVTFYQVAICESLPLTPTGTRTVAQSLASGSCQTVIENQAGASVELSKGAAQPINATFTRPANGSYGYALVVLDNTFSLSASYQFSQSMQGQTSGTGVHCRTAGNSSNSYLPTVCSSSAVTPTASSGSILDYDLSSPSVFDQTSGTVSLSNGTATLHLMKTGGAPASGFSEAAKVAAVVSLSSPVSVVDGVTGLDVRFDTDTTGFLYHNPSTSPPKYQYMIGNFSADIALF